MIVRDAVEADLPAILLIHNDAVATSTAIWDEAPDDLAARQAWFAGKTARGEPILVCALDGTVIGFATYGGFRARSGYRHTAEHSVYVADGHRRRGVARLLLAALIAAARDRGLHVLVGGIEASNHPSLALHAAFGFEAAGTLREVGTKFGRWLDLTFMQLVLEER